MRVTQSSMSRNYLKALNNNLYNYNASSERLQTGLKLNKVSDNTADAAKAFAVREQIYKKEQALDGIRDAVNELTTAEGALMSVNDVYKTVMDKLTQLRNGTYSDEQRDIAATEMLSIQKQLLQIANSTYGTKHLFGGTNNSEAPFSFDANGNVLYNGQNVDELLAYEATMTLDPPLAAGEVLTEGTPVVQVAAGPPPTYTPMSENLDIYIDIDLGLQVSGDRVDPNSAVLLSVNGLDAFGFGIDAGGDPVNIISFIGDVAEAMSANDTDRMGELLDKSKEIHTNLTTALADIGTRYNYLENTDARYEKEIITLQSAQNSLEAVDFEKEAIDMEIYERAWMVTLQLGSRVLPTSLFDFMG